MATPVRRWKGKPTQWLTVWLFFLIAVGGLFYPLLGLLMPLMMVFLLGLSYFKARYWCGNLCPRGAFLDIFLSAFTRNRPWPRFFNKPWFRWGFFVFFMSVFTVRMGFAWGSWLAVGSLFVNLCVVTSIFAIITGALTRPRAWCAICPMGTLQENLGKIGQQNRRKSAAAGKTNGHRRLPPSPTSRL